MRTKEFAEAMKTLFWVVFGAFFATAIYKQFHPHPQMRSYQIELTGGENIILYDGTRAVGSVNYDSCGALTTLIDKDNQ
jgi:hypothetical protein